ncbi:helix-turn-helix transcriptional regulator [Anaerofustis stercorihominis]|uniref:helix-turn-helix domain-containing protein n=1 Tax=Anaerofustis stercorihominis TaxID=214853 RepID=UPI00210CAE79|nr:helix-turn-helix transcriptional regulator [Anaerofustis stercorihominis]MCQ4794792.1 helix-turn-helix transcriptional regulator [Anaerofustis stercorihominis]
MAIILRLDRVMADRKISLGELADKVGISNVNLSNIKRGKISAIRFSTLNAICEVLDCQPGDILEYQKQ